MINDTAQIIRADIRQGIRTGRDLDGLSFVRLKLATVKRKRRKNSPHPTRALHDTGVMQNLPPAKEATAGNLTATVTIAKSRMSPAAIGRFHNQGGKNLPKREWFGISSRVEKKARDLQLKKLAQILRRVWIG